MHPIRRAPRRHRRLVLFDDSSPYLDRFGLLLAMTAVSIVVLSLVDLGTVDGASRVAAAWTVLTSFVASVSLLVAFRAAGLARRWQRVADAVVLVSFVSALVVAGIQVANPDIAAARDGAPPVFIIALAVLSPIVVVARLLRHRVVEGRTMAGAVSAYLLIPLAYFYVFLGVDRYQGGMFFGHYEPSTAFMYFSLTSITTVGFGDLAADSDLGRLLSVSEALVGQVYLVTFVAMIVGLVAQRRTEE